MADKTGNENIDGKVWNSTGDGDGAKNSWANGGDGGWKDVYKPADDGGDDKTPGPPDVKTPTLTMNDPGWPLPATGDMDDSGGGNPPLLTPEVPDFSISVATLRDAQTAVLPKASAATDSYNKLKTSTDSKKSWLFQQPNSSHSSTQGVIIAANTTGYDWSPQGAEGNNLDPELEAQTPIISASLDNALLSIADTVHLVGSYVNFMNNAAQVYVHADKECFLNPKDKAT